MWYDQTPASYAGYLRYAADRNDGRAAFHDADGKPWSPYEADRARRTARRLRAMALLCDAATAPAMSGVDLRRLHDPALSREEEDATVQAIEEEAAAQGRSAL